MLLLLGCTILLGESVVRADNLQNLETAFSQGKMARNDYLDRLFELRATYIESEYGKGNQVIDRKIVEIDEQMKRHPLAADSDGKALSNLRVGIWQAARHTSLFRVNHTWIMLPIVSGYDPQGLWKIEGNKYYESAQDDPPEKLMGIVILLDSRYFVARIGNQLFYEKRLKEYHGE
jgi:hypothetical protein